MRRGVCEMDPFSWIRVFSFSKFLLWDYFCRISTIVIQRRTNYMLVPILTNDTDMGTFIVITIGIY